jgi:hypothetical protein
MRGIHCGDANPGGPVSTSYGWKNSELNVSILSLISSEPKIILVSTGPAPKRWSSPVYEPGKWCWPSLNPFRFRTCSTLELGAYGLDDSHMAFIKGI